MHPATNVTIPPLDLLSRRADAEIEPVKEIREGDVRKASNQHACETGPGLDCAVGSNNMWTPQCRRWVKVGLISSTGCYLISGDIETYGLFPAHKLWIMALGFWFKINTKTDPISSIHVLIHLPSNQGSLDVAIRHCCGNLQALQCCCPCFQTGVLRGSAQCDSKSLLPLCQNEITQCFSRSLWPYLFVSLSLCKRKLSRLCQVNVLVILF